MECCCEWLSLLFIKYVRSDVVGYVLLRLYLMLVVLLFFVHDGQGLRGF